MIDPFELEDASKADLEARLAKTDRQRDRLWRRYADSINYAKVPVSTLLEALQLPAKGLRWGIGQGAKSAENMGWVDLTWEDPYHKQFRYHNQDLFKDYAAFVHAGFEALKADPTMAPALPGGLIRLIPETVRRFKADRDLGGGESAWARNNPSAVEEITLMTLDPMWTASYLTKGLKAAGASAELKAMEPIIANAMSAATGKNVGQARGAVALASKGLHAGDIVSPTYFGIIRDGVQKGMSAEEVARSLYGLGYRAAPWSMRLEDTLPFNKYLRRGGDLVSPGIRDLAEDKAWVLQAIKQESQHAFSRVPNISKSELRQIQELIHEVPRDHWNPAGTFEMNYLMQAADGKRKLVSASTFEKAKQIVSELGSGWREGGEWRSAYGPASKTVQDIELGAKSSAKPTAGVTSRSYELPRDYDGPGYFQGVENFQKWIASVGTRVQRANNIDRFVGQARDYRRVLGSSWSQAKKAGDLDAMARFATERKMVSHLITDLKSWKDTPDYVRAAKAAEPIPIVKAYDKILNVTRSLQLGLNPSWYVNNLLDSHIVKNAAETGRVDGKMLWDSVSKGEIPSALDHFGKPLSFETAPSELVYGSSGPGNTAFQRGRYALAHVMDTVENGARTALGRHAYEQNMSRMLKEGLSLENAVPAARRAARRVVAKTHFDYGIQSAADKAFRRIFMYPVFRLRDNAYWATKALEHPTEAYAIMNLRQKQIDNSFDRKGSIRIPGTNWAADPFRRSSPAQLLELALNTQGELTPEQNDQFRTGRIMQTLAGSYTPPVDELLQLVGAKPPQEGGKLAEIESVARVVGQQLGVDRYPSDYFYNFIGKHPEERREDYDKRRMNILVAGAAREGQALPPEQARDLLKHNDAVTALSNWYTGQRLVPSTPGLASVTNDLEKAKYHLVQANPEDAELIRDRVVADYPDLDKIIPLTPAQRTELVDRKIEAQQDFDKAVSPPQPKLVPFPVSPGMIEGSQPASSSGTVKPSSILDGIGSNPRFAPFLLFFNALTRPAGAAEIAPGPRYKELDGNEETKRVNGRTIIATQRPEGMNEQDYGKLITSDAAKQKALRNIDFEIEKAPSAQAIYDFVENTKDKDGNQYVRSFLERQSVKDPKYARAIEQYNYISSGGRSGSLLYAPIYTDTVRKELSRAFEDWVETGGLNAKSRANATLSQAREAIRNGSFKLPAGFNITEKDFDLAALNYSKNHLSNTAIFRATKRHQEDDDSKYPANQLWESRLRSAVDHQPKQTSEVVDGINQAIRSGQVSPQFWQGFKAREPGLFERASVTDRYDELANVRNGISVLDSRGRFRGVSLPAMVRLVEQNPSNRAYLSALRNGAAGPAFAEAIEREAQRWGNRMGFGMDDLAPNDPAFLGESFLGDFSFRTGLDKHPVFEAFQQTLVPAAPISPSSFVQTPSGIVPKATIGEAMARAEFSGAELRTTPGAGILPTPSSITPAPSALTPAGTGRAIQQAALASDFGTTSPAYSSFPTILPQSEPYQSIQLRTDPYPSMGAYLTDVVRQSQANGTGIIETGAELSKLDNGENAIPVYQTAQAVTNLASISASLAGTDRDSDVGRSIGGAQTALSTFASLSTLGVPAPVAAPLAIGAGIYQGLKGPQSKSDGGRAAAAEQNYQLRLAEFQNTLRRQSISDLRQREQDLARVVQSTARSPQAMSQIAPRLAAFSRRPTFQSRVGLVDAVERAISSSLRPRW